MKTVEAFYLDEDCHATSKTLNKAGTFCVRCGKRILTNANATACTVILLDAPYVTLGGPDFIGSDCLRLIKTNYADLTKSIEVPA